MDADEETRNFKIMAGIVLVFFMSMYASCQELKYMAWGKTVQADVVAFEVVSVSTGRYGAKEMRQRLQCTYDDGGKTVKFTDTLPMDWDLSEAEETKKVRVQFFAGDARSARLAGRPNLVAVIAFFAMLLVVIGYTIKFIRDAKRPY
ncbi:MAG: hypothetical protein WD768_20090 [Phycisphaeraceae bacterium]